MTVPLGESVLWLIPLEDVIDHIEPAQGICRTFHFTPKKLIEALVHEWFKMRLEIGPYQLKHLFQINRAMALEQIKNAFIQAEDLIIQRLEAENVERVITLTGHEVFNAVSHYVQSFGVPIEEINRMEILGWCYKCLVVKFS